MSVRYVFGGAGSGKTGYILDDIAAHTEGNLIYIVPEQFSLQSEKNLLARLKTGAAIKAQVLSFRRLAHHVFSETGGAKNSYLDDIGKTMLLRKLLYELREQLKFFVTAADKQGFMEQLAAAVSEFYQYGVSAEKLLAYAESVKHRQSLYNKLCDLALIYQSYTEYMQNRYISADAMLDVLAARIGESKQLQGAKIWISGFHGFTPQEYRVLAGLIRSAGQVTIALTLKSSAKRFNNPQESDPFYETKRTVNRLTALAAELNTAIDEPVLLKAQAEDAELGFLERHFLARAVQAYPSPPERISICRAENHYDEIHQTAADITDLVRDGGYSYSDIAVVSGDVPSYERDIRNIFELYDIPVFMDQKSDILSHPLVELIRAALDIIAYNWQYESVFRFLKTGMSALTRDEIDSLENYVLAYGVKGRRWLAEQWEYGFENAARYDRAEIHRSKEYCQSVLAPLSRRAGAKRSVREFSADIFKVLDELNINETLQNRTDELERGGHSELARQNSQIWGKVCELFDTLVDILGDEKVGVQEFAKILDAGFSSADMGIIPTAQIQVLAGDIERSRLPVIKALFVIGANEGVLPSVADNRSLLDDDERRLLDPKAEELAPGGRRRGYEQQFLIYQALSTPTERIYLSYSTGRVNGRAMQPSVLVTKLKKLYPLINERPPDYAARITLAKPMFSQMGAALRRLMQDGNAEGVLPDVYGWFLDSERYRPGLEIINTVLFEETGGEYLSSETADKLYGKEFSLNVSKLERYVQCPYAYFIRHNIGALERKVYEVQSVELGNLYHDVLERFTKELEAQSKSWRELDKNDIDSGVDACIEQIAPRLSGEVLLSTARYKYVVKRASRVLKKSIWALAEHIKSGWFEIFGTELEFSVDGPVMAVTLELANGKKLILHGRIDRIDVMDMDGKRYVKIIDYKSGNNKFDLSDIYFGTQLQLLLYMDAFIRSGAKASVLPGGVFYFNLNDPMIDYGENIFKQLDDEVLRRFKMSGLVLANADVVKAIDTGIGRSSRIIPATLTAGGEVGGSSVASLEEFNDLRARVCEKIKELGEQMTTGNINILPYKKGPITGCTYCAYGAVCRFQKNKYNINKGLR